MKIVGYSLRKSCKPNLRVTFRVSKILYRPNHYPHITKYTKDATVKKCYVPPDITTVELVGMLNTRDKQ